MLHWKPAAHAVLQPIRGHQRKAVDLQVLRIMCEEVGEAPPINLFVVVAMPQASSRQPKSNRQELTRQTRITALPSNPVGTWGPLLSPFLQQ